MSTLSVQRVAHRGGAALAPENTLAAFRHALTLPVDAIELDVQMSRDGHAIVFHDERVERLTNGRGNILDLDLAYLRSLNAAEHFSGGWPEPQRVPTLQEAMELARGGGIRVYVEIKASKRDGGAYERYPGIAEAVMGEVVASGMLEQILMISFDWELLPLLKKLAPSVQTGVLVSREVWDTRAPLSELVKRVKELQGAWINLHYKLFTPELLELCHANGLQLGVWTVNDETSLRRLAQAGVDSLTTDRPDLFAALA